jgi:uncharacterized RDD family membrane protein YckC
MTQLDTIQTIETPEGVEFDVYLAGPLPRILAAIVDLGIRIAIYSVVAVPAGLLGDFGTGLILLTMFVVEWGYPIFFEMFKAGATPGKKIFDLHVMNADGTPISWKGSILRNLLRAADFLPMGYALGIVTMACTRRFQRLGDLAGDTVVCYRRPDDLHLGVRLPEAQPVATTIPLQLEEQRAIVRYAERSERTGFSRNAELARLLDDLTGTRSATVAVAYLQGLANWIIKGR